MMSPAPISQITLVGPSAGFVMSLGQAVTVVSAIATQIRPITFSGTPICRAGTAPGVPASRAGGAAATRPR